MPYAWNGICYAETADALAAFVKSVPQSDGSAVVTLDGPASIDTAGVITWTILHRPLTDTVATSRAGTTQLPACATPSMDQYPLQSVEFLVALTFASFVGFFSGYRA